ncbi:MAG: T9SS type B sorting domain-containing protein [Flavobacteriaceae bacterium]|nr:T9SS type B sorting domain-containing protein [Flavobacteriaceae bacterium]
MKSPTLTKIIIIALLLSFVMPIHAQNYESFTPRFNEDLKGDILLIGNNILGPNNAPFNIPQAYNHYVDMQYIDIDNDPTTFSSSSAELEIPNSNCYRIIYAGLYWGAVNPGTAPINEVKLKGPTGGYHDVIGDIIYNAGTNSVDGGNSYSYACFADVTTIISSLGSESEIGTYTVANVSSDVGKSAFDIPYNGTGQSAGWSLFLVYEDHELPGKSITSFDGFSAISVPGNNSSLDVLVDGFRTVPAPAPVRANFAFATLEGDSPISGDNLRLNGIVLSTADRLSTNFFNSSVTQLDGTPVNNRTPNSSNTLGFDTGIMAIPNPGNTVIANDATSGTIGLQTSGDTYFPYFFAFAVEIIEPNIVLTKIVEDDAGNNIEGQIVDFGNPLNYVIAFQNTGNDHAVNFKIRDILPANINFNYPDGLSLPEGVSVASYNPTTREIIFDIDNTLVEENDPIYEIRIAVSVVDDCSQLTDVCSHIIENQAFATYSGFYNPTFQITDDPSLNSIENCVFTPEVTNFLVDLDCDFTEDVILCSDTINLTAADGYNSYTWSTSPTGTPVIGTGQTITLDDAGTYYSFNNAVAPCQSITQKYVVTVYDGNFENPVIPFADNVVTCPNNGKLLPNIFLCGLEDSRVIQTNITGTTSIIWEQLDETSCPPISELHCANENSSCGWNQVSTGQNYEANTSGQFRLTINYEGGCFAQFYFNVYQNLLYPDIHAEDIICTTSGTITVNNVPSGYEYSLNNINFQTSPTFTINTPGFYTVYLRQIGVPTNPCIFTISDIQIRDRDFTGTATILQPLCHSDLGSIQLAANDVDPQYRFELFENGTLVNSIGPILENTYIFENLNSGTYTANISTENGCSYSEDITIIEPPLLTATSAITIPISCEAGEITVYPVGGTPPYFYFVNNSTEFQTTPKIVANTIGTYDILILDANNCEATTSIAIDEILKPEFTVDPVNIECADTTNSGEIHVNVTAANGYSLAYSIDGGTTFVNTPIFTALANGVYEVIVQYSFDDSVCETTPQTVIIAVDSTIVGEAELSTPLTCVSTGTITVNNVSSENPPYTYSLDGINFQSNNTFTGLTAGTYNVIIKDANFCTTTTNTVVIEALDPPNNLVIAHTPLSCPTDTTTATITSVTGGIGTLEYQIIAPTAFATNYQTSHIFNGLESGTYTFQVRDGNHCLYSEIYTIDTISAPSANIVLTQNLNCTTTPNAILNGTITGTSPYTYAVSINNGAYTSLGATGEHFNYSALTEGTYQFEITDANGCIALSNSITITPISLPNFNLIEQSNPILCSGDANASLAITIDTTVGTAPFNINVNNDSTGVNYGTQTSGLSVGTYTITVTDSNFCEATETITITEPEPIAVDYEAVDIMCFEEGVSKGSIIINTVTGGTAPYNYFITSTNGYDNSALNTSGATSINFDLLDFGLYQINVVDANGCSILIQDVLIASPPTDLDIVISDTIDCIAGGQTEVSVESSLSSSGPFFFSIYQGATSVYPNPTESWIPEDTPGSKSATFTELTSGITYTFIVYDASTHCSYYETSTTPIPTNSTLFITELDIENITCRGNNDGNISFVINSIYNTDVDVHYEIFDSLTLISTGIYGTGTVSANGILSVDNLGNISFGNYFILISETSGPNSGCAIATSPINITESEFPLNITTSIDQNANCNQNSGIISVIAENGTAPYHYQITTTATPPLPNNEAWQANSVFNVNAGNYYLHVIDDVNCIVTSPLTIVPSDPEPIISASVSNICEVPEGLYEIDVTLEALGIPPYIYSINGGSFQNMTAPFTLSNLYSGTHTIEIKDVNGCGNLVTVDIMEPLHIVPQIESVPTCNIYDGQIAISTSGGSGAFTYAISPNPPSTNLSESTFYGVPPGVYTVTVTDTTTSCFEEVTVALGEAIPPTVTINTTDVTCFGEASGTIDIDIQGYTGTYTYEVFDSSGNSVTGSVNADTTTNPLPVTGMTAGSFSIDIIATQPPFCKISAAFAISSPIEPLTLNATEISNVSCDNSQGIIYAVADGGWGNYQYEIIGNATSSYSSTNTFSNLSAGNYTVNVIDDKGCVASVNMTLSPPNPIDGAFTPSANILGCFGDQNASISITNVTGGLGHDYIYTLNTILPTTSSSGPQTSNIFENLGAGTYTVTISDGNNCTHTSLEMIIDTPASISSILATNTTQTCLNPATLTLSASGGTGQYTYSDDSNFNTILGTFNSTITFSVTPGTHQYYVRDANGCIGNVSNDITIETIPDLTLNFETVNPTINCVGDNTGSIIVTAQGGFGNYVYTLLDESGLEILEAQNTSGIFTGLVSGTYSVYLESDDCNITSDPITITEPETPLEATFIVNDITCTGNSDGQLIINATGGTGIIQYAISPHLNQFFETHTFNNLSAGDYEVIVQDQLGCYLTYHFSITNPEQVILSLVPDTLYEETCIGDANGAFSIDISGGNSPYSVSLDTPNGPYTTGSIDQNIFDFEGVTGGDHMVYVKDARHCETQWNIPFPETPRFNPDITLEAACENNAVRHTVTVHIEGTETLLEALDYSLNGGQYQSSNVFTNVPSGHDNYIDVRHTNGCVKSTEFFYLESYNTLSLELIEGDGLGHILAIATGGTGGYEFTLNEHYYGTTNSFEVKEDGTYIVTVTDSAGCKAIAEIEIEIQAPCIPNYFTPNGDGVLDYWSPGCLENYPNLTFDIFDRYGRRIGSYRSGQKWDGRYNGKALPTGDYWYVVKPNNGILNKEYVGHFTLYR